MVRWTSAAIKMSRQILLALIVVAFVWLLYSVAKRYIALALGPKDLAPATAQTFQDADVVKWVPTTCSISEVTSDKTADAILSGAFGPAVVVFYADWCVHCQNMMGSYAAAAAKAHIPFVKVQGGGAPVTSRKYGVTGYPTVFGVANVGGLPRRYGAARTEQAFLEFANALSPVEAVAAPAAVPAAAAVASVLGGPAAPVVPPVAAVEVLDEPEVGDVATGAAIAAIPPIVHVTDA